MSRNPFRFHSLRSRLTAITLLVVGGVVVAVALLSVVVSGGAMLRAMEADLRRRGMDFAQEVGRRGEAGPSHPEGMRPPGNGMAPPGGGEPERRRNFRTSSTAWVAPTAIPVGSDTRGADPNSTPYDEEGFERAARGESCFTTVTVDGEPQRVFSTPSVRKGRVTNVIQVASAMRPALDELNELRWTLFLVVAPLGLALGGVASFVVVGQLLTPLRRLNDEALLIGREGSSRRLNVHGDDEFADLTATLNGMLGSLESTNRSLQGVVEGLRRFTGDASHELKTPLTALKAYLGVLKASRRAVAEEGEALRAMEGATNRMSGLVEGLLELAHADGGLTGEREPCRLDAILREVADSAGGPVRLRTSPATVDGACDELFGVFSNLVENALKHSKDAGPVEVGLRAENGFAVVTVADRGVGIAPEHLPHLFERFYRVDRSRASATGGTGLGLAIAQGIVQGHGGEIAVASVLGEGTRFTVRLPLFPADFQESL